LLFLQVFSLLFSSKRSLVFSHRFSPFNAMNFEEIPEGNLLPFYVIWMTSFSWMWGLVFLQVFVSATSPSPSLQAVVLQMSGMLLRFVWGVSPLFFSGFDRVSQKSPLLPFRRSAGYASQILRRSLPSPVFLHYLEGIDSLAVNPRHCLAAMAYSADSPRMRGPSGESKTKENWRRLSHSSGKPWKTAVAPLVTLIRTPSPASTTLPDYSKLRGNWMMLNRSLGRPQAVPGRLWVMPIPLLWPY